MLVKKLDQEIFPDEKKGNRDQVILNKQSKF